MNVDELNALERYLEIWMFNIRSAKVIQHKAYKLLEDQLLWAPLKLCYLTDADNDSRDPGTEEQGKSINNS